MREPAEVYRILQGEDSNVVLDHPLPSPDVEPPVYDSVHLNHLRTVIPALISVSQVMLT